MANPFTSIQCAIRHDNARVVSWTMDPKGNYPDNFILAVENSRAGGPWETLTNEAKDMCTFVDTRRRNYNKYMNEHYRLRLAVPGDQEGDPPKEEWVSEVCEAGKFQAWPFSPEAENAVKQIEKAIEISGCTGILLKRKHWGERCPECTDFDDQATVNEHCPYCLGTGFKGGYYQGISLAIIKDSIAAQETNGDDCVEGFVNIQARCIAYPWIRYGDVWVEDGTNKRFQVGKATPVASYKQTTLVYSVQLHQIEYSDVMYTPAANARLDPVDLFNSAQVNYTPEVMEHLEDSAIEDWKKDLDKL